VVDQLKLSEPVNERPLEDWSTIAVEFLGAQSQIIEGPQWSHHVIHMGDGPPVFMYHGIGGHAETYARTLPQIAKAGYHVYAVDALYHGHSSKPDVVPGMGERTAAQAGAVVDLMDALGYDKVHYEGESMGAGIGFELGMLYPDRCGKMILNGFGSVRTEKPMSEFPPSPGPKGEALFPLSVAAVTDPSYENIAKRLHWLVKVPDRITPEMVQVRQRLYQDPEINASMRKVFSVGQPGPDFAEMMKLARSEADVKAQWKHDTLILWGDHNPGQGPEYGAYCAEMIGAKFYEFEDAGHWPQWEKPDEYSAVIIEFLNS
jgi:pimeloyl-ACP methyl ester carboxylesterase